MTPVIIPKTAPAIISLGQCTPTNTLAKDIIVEHIKKKIPNFLLKL